MSNKTLISNLIAMEDNDTWTYDTRSISTVFKNFSSLAESLLIKLPNPPDSYNLESINYYSSFTIADDFCLNKTSENKVLNIILKMRYLTLLVQTRFLENFYEMRLIFYQCLYVKSLTFQYPLEFSRILAKF